MMLIRSNLAVVSVSTVSRTIFHSFDVFLPSLSMTSASFITNSLSFTCTHVVFFSVEFEFLRLNLNETRVAR